ncbi:MAG: hypothetical protein LBB31_01770 [Prevotellaceae bacterium]|jgi:hypothetical protein|nr:hypothetical protein [Prevotellaceae bacterium]
MMKHISKYLLAGLLVFAYGMSIIGVGKHYCRCEETAQVVVLPAVEHHTCKHDHLRQEETATHCCHAAQETATVPCGGVSETESATGGECCTVQVELLQIDQNLPAISKVIPDLYSLSCCCPAVALFTHHAPVMAAIIRTNPPPLLADNHSLFLRMQQWRL